MAEQDPTQTGGQEEKQTERQSVEEQIAAKVNSAQAEDLAPLDVDANGDLQYARDEKGRFAPKEEAVEPVADKAPVEVVADKAPAPAPAPAKVKVKVYGQEEEVDVDRLIEDGKRYYQKDRAADIKLQNAARLEREWLERTSQPRAQPSQDAEPQPGATQQSAPTTPVETDDARIERVVYNRETMRARKAFDAEFPEIAADPYLMNMAAQLEQERLATVAALGEPLGDPVEAYREHGTTVRQWMKKFQPANTVVTSEEKVERKKTTSAVPGNNAKAPAPEEDKPQTIAQVIAEERKSRQGRPVPQRTT